MKIMMIANYVIFPWEGGNSRFIYLLNKFNNKLNQIELVTSNFRHGTKEKRKINKNKLKELPYKVTLLDEPGYKKNVSLKRLYSHKILSKNLKKYLDKLDYKPDVIYCSIPSLDFAKEAAKYAKKNNIRFIIDIQDLWPEAFKMVFKVPIINNLIFNPMKKKADYIYKTADEIVAVSQTYVERGLSVNKKVKKGLSVFLGTELEYFDKCAKENKIEFNDNLIRIAYIGTLGHSYDIKCIIDAICCLNKKGLNNIKFIVMGNGPLKENFEKYAEEKKINCEFTGRLDYPKMVGLLCSCDIAVNPIAHNAAQSIINKVGDYASAGLPVISTQECEEYRNLIDEYQAGLNCINGNIDDIANNIEKLIKNEELRKKMGANNRKLAEEKFDRQRTYKEIVDIILKK